MTRQILVCVVGLLLMGMEGGESFGAFIQVGGGLTSGGGTTSAPSYEQFGSIGTVSTGEEAVSTNYRNAAGLIRTVAATTTAVLTLYLDGSGGGSINDGSGFSCISGTPGVRTVCTPRSVAAGQVVTLMPVPDNSSFFSGWNGACTGLHPLDQNSFNCRILMGGNRTVTATFDRQKPVLIKRLTYAFFDTLSLACGAAQIGEEILLMEGVLTESPIFNRAVSVKVRGGYDSGYTSNSGGETVIDGTLRIMQGAVRVERIKVR